MESRIDMLQQRREWNQQQTCRNNEQKRINNRHAARMNKSESITDMSQQATEPDK
jgi:hypothetical protein